MKKPLLLLLALAVSGAGAWALWLPRAPAPADGVLVLYGNVDIRQIALAFEGSGRVTDVYFEEGDSVQAGDVLARLDTRTLQLQAAQARAQIAVQQHTLAHLRNGARPQELAQARSRVAAAQADAARAAQDLARVQALADSSQGRGISRGDVDAARSTSAVAQARLAEQHAAQRLLEEGARPEEIAAAAAQLEVAQAQLALLQHQIAQGELRAPVNAQVRTRLLEAGDMASPQRPVFALALQEAKWVRVWVDEPDLGRVHGGMRAQVFTDSQPDAPIAGHVGYIASVAEFTPKAVQTPQLRSSLVYEVRVLVPDAHKRLRLGQPATVHLLP